MLHGTISNNDFLCNGFSVEFKYHAFNTHLKLNSNRHVTQNQFLAQRFEPAGKKINHEHVAQVNFANFVLILATCC